MLNIFIYIEMFQLQDLNLLHQTICGQYENKKYKRKKMHD